MADRSPLVDAKAMERALVGELLDEVAPKFPTLSASERALLRDDPEEFFKTQRPDLVAWKRWAMNAPDWYLSKYSYGVDIKRKLLQLDYERAFPQTQRLAVTTDRLTDAELIEVLQSVGVLALPRASDDAGEDHRDA